MEAFAKRSFWKCLRFNSETGKICAIEEVKVITDDDGTSKECLSKLKQEIAFLSELSHRNIVQYYGSELGEETLSVYVEYRPGGSISSLLQQFGPFRECVIQKYTRQILLGLAYLHGQNIVHRDIKGANIVVDHKAVIQLADFGITKQITACSSKHSCEGSTYWMAPEIVKNRNGYSLPADIWSLGCTILEMALVKPSWSEHEAVAAIFKIAYNKDIPEIPDHLSNDAKHFLRLCLRRDPSKRPTALQLLDHPFVREQTKEEVSPYTSDGSCILFAPASKNKAQHIGQDQSGSAPSDSEHDDGNKRTREHEECLAPVERWKRLV